MPRRSLDEVIAPSPGTAPGRRWRRALGFGLIAGTLAGFTLVGLIAAPLFLWAAATEPAIGLQRPFVRRGLRAAPLFGLLAFAVTAIVATRWRLRDRSAGERTRMGSHG